MQKLFVATLVVITSFVGDAKSEIIAHWAADGNYLDSVGDHHGSPFGDTDFKDGVFGEAFFFGNGGGHVLVPDSTDFAFGTGDFSVTFRVNYVRIVFNGSGVIDKDSFRDPSTTEYNGWLFNNAGLLGGIGIETRNVPSAGPYNNRYDTSNFDLATWYNITATRRRNVTRLYIDSELIGEIAESTPADVTNSVDLIIGALRPVSPSNQILHGSVDDVAIYNHALSILDVRRVFLYGVADSDAAASPGDLNLDGTVDLLDVMPFADLLSDGGFQVEADVNLDGALNLLDVQPFVDLLSGP